MLLRLFFIYKINKTTGYVGGSDLLDIMFFCLYEY